MGAGRARRARRGAVLGPVLELCPTEKEGWGTPRTALTNERAAGRGAGWTVAAVMRNLLNLSLTLDPPSTLLDPPARPAHTFEGNTLLLTATVPRTQLLHSRSCSRFTHCSSPLLHPGLGTGARDSPTLDHGASCRGLARLVLLLAVPALFLLLPPQLPSACNAQSFEQHGRKEWAKLAKQSVTFQFVKMQLGAEEKKPSTSKLDKCAQKEDSYFPSLRLL